MTGATPKASSSDALRRMQRQRRADTQPELRLRAELHRAGLRYRIHHPLPGTRRRADVVFSGARVAVFVDGCFWHCCPEHGTKPRNNAEWWSAKLAGNVLRDRDTDRRLVEQGWRVVRVWEHEDPAEAARRVASAVRERAAATGGL
jgi:DNA mismatch endonuclease (patch repair protein)